MKVNNRVCRCVGFACNHEVRIVGQNWILCIIGCDDGHVRDTPRIPKRMREYGWPATWHTIALISDVETSYHDDWHGVAVTDYLLLSMIFLSRSKKLM